MKAISFKKDMTRSTHYIVSEDHEFNDLSGLYVNADDIPCHKVVSGDLVYMCATTCAGLHSCKLKQAITDSKTH